MANKRQTATETNRTHHRTKKKNKKKAKVKKSNDEILEIWCVAKEKRAVGTAFGVLKAPTPKYEKTFQWSNGVFLRI